MAAYHQMGDKSWNLISMPELASFGGVILSPVNCNPEDSAHNLKGLGERLKTLDIVLDPQMYKPASDRGRLPDWKHITKDFETADLGDLGWWEGRCQLLVEAADTIGANSIASPAIIPRVYDADYYDWVVNCGDRLQSLLKKNQSALLTAIVSLAEIGRPGVPERIASILTRTSIGRVYLVLHDDIPPRTQRMDAEGLAGAMKLIELLEDAGTRVLVACCGLDMLLWKEAGATDVATGKFFNLRRFVPGRWDEPEEKGRVVPYWTDDERVTWLRENDVLLLLRHDLLTREKMLENPLGKEILEILDRRAGEPWVGLSWRQYMHWFAARESDIDHMRVDVSELLMKADRSWAELEKKKVLLFERSNNGEWIRPWLNAISLQS